MSFRYDSEEFEDAKELLLQNRKLCLSTPLRSYDTLEWKGPSLYPNSLAPRQDTNQQRRTPIDILLSKRSPARSTVDRHWTLSLVEPIQIAPQGGHLRSQVWKCQVQCTEFGVGRGVKMTVVLKMYYPGVYDHKDKDKQYTSHLGLVEGEATAYERFKHLQGSDVPFCYGFFKFTTHFGFEVVGEVLEDLTAFKTLSNHADRMHNICPGTADAKVYIDRMITECLRSRFRLNQAGVILLGKGVLGDSIIVLQTPSDPVTRESELLQSEETIHLVNVGFGITYTLEEFKNQTNRNSAYEGKDFGDLLWKHREYTSLILNLDQVFGSEQRKEWVEMEKRRGLITEYKVY